MKLKTKTIKHSNGDIFLIRVSLALKSGSIKLHLMLNDDIEPHSHPWDFTSFILFGGYKEKTDQGISDFRIFSTNRKSCEVKHHTFLYRIFGIPLPCITIGRYGTKKTLCSLCQKLGYCKSSKPISL